MRDPGRHPEIAEDRQEIVARLRQIEQDQRVVDEIEETELRAPGQTMARMQHDLQRHGPQRRAVQRARDVEIVEDGDIEHADLEAVDEALVVALPPSYLEARISRRKRAEQRRDQEWRDGDQAADI